MTVVSRLLTFDERLLIEKYLKEGKSCCEISKLIGRSKNGVVKEVRKVGRENYSAKKSQEDYERRRDAKIKKMSEQRKKSGIHPSTRMKNKIDALHMQLEIVLETLNELMKKL